MIARQIEFTMKAEIERLRDGLTVEDVLESVVNANAVKKTICSRSTSRAHAREHLYVIESPNFTGTWIYTKGTIRSASGRTGRCPTCGSNRVAHVVEDITLRVGRRTHRFDRVPHECCQACAERVFGIEASKRFDAVV